MEAWPGIQVCSIWATSLLCLLFSIHIEMARAHLRRTAGCRSALDRSLSWSVASYCPSLPIVRQSGWLFRKLRMGSEASKQGWQTSVVCLRVDLHWSLGSLFRAYRSERLARPCEGRAPCAVQRTFGAPWWARPDSLYLVSHFHTGAGCSGPRESWPKYRAMAYSPIERKACVDSGSSDAPPRAAAAACAPRSAQTGLSDRLMAYIPYGKFLTSKCQTSPLLAYLISLISLLI